MTTKKPESFGELVDQGYEFQPVKLELRKNLIQKLTSSEDLFTGVLGYDDTVIPQLVNALLGCQDIILLGERGQAKSKIVRGLTSLLDESIPVLADTEIPESPFCPVTSLGKEIVKKESAKAKISWIGREERYAEKLATPDITIADLIGEVDPVKIAEGRYLADESSIHFGLVPRANLGIFAINELPDLAERIQVGLLNVLEERDIQIRGFKIRLPLDVFLVVTANPEDYTNRGRLITPLKDRFGSQVRTHYPQSIDQELEIVKQEAQAIEESGLEFNVPSYMEEIVVEITHAARASSDINQRSGVSVRTSIAMYEALLANAMRRALMLKESSVVPRISDLPFVIPSLYGKLEFDVFDESEEDAVLQKLIDQAVLNVWQRHFESTSMDRYADAIGRKLGGDSEIEVGVYQPLASYTQLFKGKHGLNLRDQVIEGSETKESNPAKPASLLESASEELGEDSRRWSLIASELEFLLEGLYLENRLSKESSLRQASYRSKTVPV